jgi:glucokinase
VGIELGEVDILTVGVGVGVELGDTVIIGVGVGIGVTGPIPSKLQPANINVEAINK